MKTLVVGGTGMLSGVVQQLLDAGDEVYSISRHAPNIRHRRLKALLLDYSDTDVLQAGLTALGPFHRAVVWIHSVATEAPFVVAKAVTGPYFHVLGSATADPSRPDTDRQENFSSLGTDYREVILGFRLTLRGSRWLTHAEISTGVWQAMKEDARRMIVGTVEPCSAWP